MQRTPLTKQQVEQLQAQGLSVSEIAQRLGYAKRTVYDFIQKINSTSQLGNGEKSAGVHAHLVQSARTVRTHSAQMGEAEYYLKRRIEDLEGMVQNQKEEIFELKDDNRELTKERNKLSRDLELAEERKQLDLLKLNLQHSNASKNTLSGVLDTISSNEKLGHLALMLTERFLGKGDQQKSAPSDNMFASAAAGIIEACEPKKQAMLATVVEALASADNERTLEELFSLATGQEINNKQI